MEEIKETLGKFDATLEAFLEQELGLKEKIEDRVFTLEQEVENHNPTRPLGVAAQRIRPSYDESTNEKKWRLV